MHAKSFIYTLGYVESRAVDAAEHARDGVAAGDAAEAATDAVQDLALLSACLTPLPVLVQPSDPAVDEALVGLFDDLYAGRSPADAELSTVTLAGRARTADGETVVPLPGAGPAAANRYVLIAWLVDRLPAVVDRCERVVERLTLLSEDRVGSAWEVVVEGLDLLARVLSTVIAVVRWTNPPDSRLDDGTERTRELSKRVLTILEDR